MVELTFPATVREGYRVTIPSNFRELYDIDVGTKVKVTIEVQKPDRRHTVVME